MKSIGVILLLCCGAVQLAFSQTTLEPPVDCSDIGDTVQAITGVDLLGVCPNIPSNQQQCCTQELIEERLEKAEDLFLDGLRDELEQRFAVVRQILQQLREHLNVTFVSNYFNQLSSFTIFSRSPSARGKRDLPRIGDFARELRGRLFDDDDNEQEGDDDDNNDDDDSQDRTPGGGFDERGFLDRVIRDSVQNAVDLFQDQRNCVRDVVEDHFDEVNEDVNARALENIERAMKLINRLEQLLNNITSRLAGFRPLNVCVRTLVQLNTCGRCVSPRPPFCRNVCGALARACYSPFEDAMSNELESLWVFVRKVVDVVDDTLDKVEDFDLFDIDQEGLLNELRERCSIDVADIFGTDPTDAPGRRRRQDTDTTEEESDGTSSGDGDDNDGSDDSDDSSDSDGIGKRLRLPAIILTLAKRLARGPFGYPGRSLPSLCNRLRVRNRNCWDGDEELDNDIPEFTDDDIEGQDQNPVIQIPTDDLQAAAQALASPVSDLISDPEFQAVVPQTLTVPDGSSASGLVTSVAVFALSLLSAVFML